VAAIPAVAFRWYVTLPPAADLAVIGTGYLALFALLGTLVGVIRREDWTFAGRWLSMRQLVQKPDAAGPSGGTADG